MEEDRQSEGENRLQEKEKSKEEKERRESQRAGRAFFQQAVRLWRTAAADTDTHTHRYKKTGATITSIAFELSALQRYIAMFFSYPC